MAPPYEGADTVILMNWASVGILDEDEWYVIRLRRTGDVVQQLPLVWTKTTALRLPPDLYVEGLTEPQRFHWQVAIMRQTGEDEDEQPTGEIISPWSGTRTFTWK